MSHTSVRVRSTNRGSGLKTIPTVRTLNPLSSTLALKRDPLNFLQKLVREYGDIVQFRLFTMPIVFINHPEYIKHLLIDNHTNYDKNVFLYHVVKPVLRDGLIDNPGGAFWLRQRRLVQPAFHRERIAKLGTIMTDKTQDMLALWDKKAAEGRVFEVTEDLGYLTLQIVIRSLFSMDIGGKARIFEEGFTEAHTTLGRFARFPFPPLSVPTPSHLRLKKAIRRMDEFISTVIHQRRRSDEEYGDLLEMLLETIDNGSNGGMSVQELHHEILNIVVGGYETTTHALTWTWYLLSQHPEVEQRLVDEVEQVLGGRVPTMDDLPKLAYTRMVIHEGLRLYCPAFQSMRRSIGEDQIGGYYVPANSFFLWDQYTTHRHPDFWEYPERFYPEHFSPENMAKRPRHAFIPFGYGPRICVGQDFAMAEMQIVLAMIAQRYRFTLAPHHPPMQPEVLVTLRPKHGVHVKLERR